MQHFVLGAATGLLIWLSILIVYQVKGWKFPTRFSKAPKWGRYLLSALLFTIIGGAANVAIDIDFLIHQATELPYRFSHTPMLVIGAILTVTCASYLWKRAPNGQMTFASLLVLVIGFSFVTHVLQDYLFNLF